MYRTVFWTLWERERVEWFGRVALKCKMSYKKRITSPGSMQDTGCLGLVHWDDKEGLYGQGGGRGVQTPSSNNTREDSTHGHHQMVNTEIRLIIFFAGKMEKLYTVSKNKTGS